MRLIFEILFWIILVILFLFTIKILDTVFNLGIFGYWVMCPEGGLPEAGPC